MKALIAFVKKEYAHLVPLFSGLALVVTGLVQDTGGTKEAITSGGGIVLALGSTIAKLFSDSGVKVATVQAAGSDVAAQLPTLKSDLASVASFVTSEWPAAKTALAAAQSDVESLKARANAVPGLDEIVSAVRQSLLGTPAANVAPAAPAPTT